MSETAMMNKEYHKFNVARHLSKESKFVCRIPVYFCDKNGCSLLTERFHS